MFRGLRSLSKRVLIVALVGGSALAVAVTVVPLKREGPVPELGAVCNASSRPVAIWRDGEDEVGRPTVIRDMLCPDSCTTPGLDWDYVFVSGTREKCYGDSACLVTDDGRGGQAFSQTNDEWGGWAVGGSVGDAMYRIKRLLVGDFDRAVGPIYRPAHPDRHAVPPEQACGGRRLTGGG